MPHEGFSTTCKDKNTGSSVALKWEGDIPVSWWFNRVILASGIVVCIYGTVNAGSGRDVVLLIESPQSSAIGHKLSTQSVISPLLQHLTESDYLSVITYRDSRVNVLQALENISIEKKLQIPDLINEVLVDTSQVNTDANKVNPSAR